MYIRPEKCKLLLHTKCQCTDCHVQPIYTLLHKPKPQHCPRHAYQIGPSDTTMLIVDNLSVTEHWPTTLAYIRPEKCKLLQHTCTIAMWCWYSLQDENEVPVLQAMTHLQMNSVALFPARLSPRTNKTFLYCKQRKAGRGLGMRLWFL